MIPEADTSAQKPQAIDPDVAVKLRADPPRVVRLSRKAIGLASACAFALIGGILIYALLPDRPKEAPELHTTQGVAVADNVASAPGDYAQIPRLGPPLPGDLGKPILDAQARANSAGLQQPISPAPLPPISTAGSSADQIRQRAEQERESARSSRLFFGGAAGGQAPSRRDSTTQAGAARAEGPATDPNAIAANGAAYAAHRGDPRTQSPERLSSIGSGAVLQAGSVIPAALITGIRSDLPGLVTAQVTQNVYDTLTGRILLIPQGSRLIGDYGSDVAFGQSRVLLSWNRLILPDGRSIVLERQPAADTRGFAGLEDGTDYHWGGVIRAALVSTLLGAGAELGSGDDGDLARAFRRGTQDSINRAGEQIVSRELNIRPSLTIRPGFPVRVLVTRDIILDSGQ
jgi:type IV secretory pathway VirB10-like protein